MVKIKNNQNLGPPTPRLRRATAVFLSMKRVFVFIDGGNFYFKLKDLTFRLRKCLRK